MTSKLRTKSTFIKQSQREHHLKAGRSPLLDIPNFDPIKSVFLDSMHLLFLGIMKWIMQQLLGTTKRINRNCKLPVRDIDHLNFKLKILVKFIPKEFQRKNFDLNNFIHWKATQFRFFLHYCGALVLHNILPKEIYKHFLLLVVACRILCDPELCVDKVSYARELLQKFFELIPSFYGSDSQVINIHNLIHLADDVEYTKIHLSAISAFPFENYLGNIKRLIVGRNNPLAQLARRISEQKACPEIVKKNAILQKKKFLIVNCNMHEDKVDFENIMFNGVTLSTSLPNNIVKLYSGDIFKITRIRKEQQNIYLYGYKFKDVSDVFKFPCKSTEVGIMKLGKLSRCEKKIPVECVLKKCIFFKNGCDIIAISYLHDC